MKSLTTKEVRRLAHELIDRHIARTGTSTKPMSSARKAERAARFLKTGKPE